MHLIVGLGNPGPDYEGTRHNIGFEVIAEVVRRAGSALGRAPSRLRGTVAQTGAGDEAVIYLAPATFMNDSGSSVRAALVYYKIATDRLLVVHDDIDLGFGRLRLQVGGGSGGHNGIRSVESHLGSREFSRLKFGVGRPTGSMDPADYVLRPFTKAERPEVDIAVSDAADIVETWVSDPARAQQSAAMRNPDEP